MRLRRKIAIEGRTYLIVPEFRRWRIVLEPNARIQGYEDTIGEAIEFVKRRHPGSVPEVVKLEPLVPYFRYRQ